MFAGLTAANAAVPIVLALLSTVISFIRINGRRSRLRNEIKESLALAKLASESESGSAKEKAEGLADAQLDRLIAFDAKAANRQYDKQSLGVVVFLLVVGVPLAWSLFLPGWIVTAVLGWVVIVFLGIFVPTGVVMFFLGSTRRVSTGAQSGS